MDAEEKPERFHAALNAKGTTYLYRISIGDVPSVFERKYTYYSFKTPDVERMRAAAEGLLGKHDFKYFSTVKKSKSTEREVRTIDIYQDPPGDTVHHDSQRISAQYGQDDGVHTSGNRAWQEGNRFRSAGAGGQGGGRRSGCSPGVVFAGSDLSLKTFGKRIK